MIDYQSLVEQLVRREIAPSSNSIRPLKTKDKIRIAYICLKRCEQLIGLSVLESIPDDDIEIVRVLFLRADATFELGKFLESTRYLDQLIAIAPSSMAYNNRGQAYLELGELSNAQNDFLEAIAIDSSNVIAIAAAASCFAQRKDFTHAIDYYDKAIMIDPNQSSLLISKAIALYEVERWGDAYETLLAAKQLSPDDKTVERYLSSIEEHFAI